MMEHLEIEIYDHIESAGISHSLAEKWRDALIECLEELFSLPKGPDHVLGELNLVEISLVDDESIAEIHARFLDDPTPTDVITFPHGGGIGEILVSVDTAKRQAAELGEPWEREVFRYMVHGMLHLHGHLDYVPEQRELMFALQEPLVVKYWK